MQQRTGWRNLDLISATFGSDGFEPVEDVRQIRAPDIATVDDAQRQHQPLGRLLQDVVELVRRADEIDVKPTDRKRHRGVEIVAEPAKIAGQHDLQCRQRVGKHRVTAPQRVAGGDIEIEHEAGFVELHPFRASCCEFAQDFDVNRKQPVQQRQRVEASLRTLGEF